VDVVTDARVALLDGFALRLPSGRATAEADDLPHGVQRLVAYLSLCRRPARTAIAGQLWPEVPEDNAHRSLRSALWRLQKVAPGVVHVSGGTLSLARTVRVDVRELTEWAQRMLDPTSALDGTTVPDVGLRGELLPGWYDDWVLLERERLRQLRMHALEALAEKLAAAGRYGEAVQAAYAAVVAEPLRESAHRALIRAYLAEGNRGDAIAHYRAYRRLLQEELGLEPSSQMNDLVQAVAGR
jgi:DNA-binding SARP family transcriptional activator